MAFAESALSRILSLTFPLRVTCIAAALASSLAVPAAHAAHETTQGVLPDGTPYRIDFPTAWNGAVLIGLDYAGRDLMAEGDANVANRKLLEDGYAMAGTTRTVTGWAIHLAAANAVQTLDLFSAKYGKPKYAIQFGSSQGGHAAAVGIQAYPKRWDGAVIQCGGLSGTVGQWQGKFDALFVARTLLAPKAQLPITSLPGDFRTSAMPAWHRVLDTAQQTPQGRARIAFAARIGQLPDWSDSAAPPPAASDFRARQLGLYTSLSRERSVADQALSSRWQIEALSGGNITGNAGVDYANLLREADGDGMVATLYKESGLDLKADLEALAHAPRVMADRAALAYVASGVFDGMLQAPVLTLNAIADPISTVASQQAYQAAVEAAGKGAMLRQIYTASAGHCAFSPGETLAAVQVLVQRLKRGEWPAIDAAAMNHRAQAALPGPARFIAYAPARFLRPYGPSELARDLGGQPKSAAAQATKTGD
jgi:pimeloyl-ACP methyl ester carboxylesterase